MITPSREAAIAVAKKLIDAKYTAFLAGGCVRDRLLGLEPADHDVATDARPDDIRRIFPTARGVGEAFGVMLVRRRGITIEVATFRSDGTYADGRRPTSVDFADARADALRRDFTINGLFEDPLSGEIVDFVGGRADLESRILRAIGEPERRFDEDRLRMLRAVRFAARFELVIDPRTHDAIRAHASDLAGVSRERTGNEMRRIVSHRTRVRGAALVEELGLDGVVLLEDAVDARPHRHLAACRDADGAEHSDALDPATALAAWMLDRSAAHAGAIDDERAARWRDALLLSNREHASLRAIGRAWNALAEPWSDRPVAARKRLAVMPGFAEALRFRGVVDAEGIAEIDREVEAWRAAGTLAPIPWLDGAALIAAGFEPGPRFASLLAATYDAQLEERVHSVDEALAFARELADDR